MHTTSDPREGSTTALHSETAARQRLMQRGVRAGLPVPDAVFAVLFASAAVIQLLRPELVLRIQPFTQQLLFGMLIEGGFLMMQAALVDVATRLRTKPPLWLGIGIMVALLLFSMGSLQTLQFVLERGGWVVLIPLLVSMAERATLMWRMPTRPRIEKLAERALISNRITVALMLLASFAIVMATITLTKSETAIMPILCLGGAFYYGVAAFDSWRVRGRRFAGNPRVLFRYDFLGIDQMHSL